MTAPRRTWAEVDLAAVAANVRAMRALLPPGCRFMAVVKADAYGHGMIPLARTALQAGASHLGVATLDEALALRRAGIPAPVLILGALAAEELAEALAVEPPLSVAIASPEMIDAARALGAPRLRAHLKVDTGMTRLGILPAQVPAALDALAGAVTLEGCFTHLACADDPDPAFTEIQLARFAPAVAVFRQASPRGVAHAAGSAAVLAHPRSHLDMVRVGLAIYGAYPAPHLRDRVALRPAMRLMSRVVRTQPCAPGTAVSYGAAHTVARPTVIATVACGYADGYPRQAGGRGQVAIGGRRYPVVGRVNMDYLMVDVGDAPVRVGEAVELFGGEIGVDEVAAWADSISYQIFCGVGPRVPRVYVGAAESISRPAGAGRAEPP